MKKFLLSGTIILVCVCAQSQVIAKGQKIIGGNFQYTTSFTETNLGPSGNNMIHKERGNTFTLSPSYGKAIGRNSVAGVFLHLNYQRLKVTTGEETTGDFKSASAGPGLYYEKYFNLGKRFFLSADGKFRVAYGTQSSKGTSSSSKGKTFQSVFTVTPHIGIQINENLLLQVNPGEIFYARYDYEWTKIKADWATDKTYTSGRSSWNSQFFDNCKIFNAGIGIRYLLQ